MPHGVAAWAWLAWHHSQCASLKGQPRCALPRPPITPLCQAKAHHLPLCTDVGSRPQDHQKPQLGCQVQEGFHVPVPSKVINSRQRLMVVPGDVAGARGEISMWGLRAPRHDGEPSHRLVPLLLGTDLQPKMRMPTGTGLGLAQAHACAHRGILGVPVSPGQGLVPAPCDQTTPLPLSLLWGPQGPQRP